MADASLGESWAGCGVFMASSHVYKTSSDGGTLRRSARFSDWRAERSSARGHARSESSGAYDGEVAERAAVTGVFSYSGGEIARQLLDRGVEVIQLSRRASRMVAATWMARDRIELSTPRFSVACSTN
jgi:hypothetical protein